jgi:ATP-dependent helicase/DNAse subunit B
MCICCTTPRLARWAVAKKAVFLLQLEYELQGQSLIDMRQKIVMAPLVVDIVPPKPICVEKNEEIIAELDRFLTNTPKTEELPLKRLAPTSINAYINCPMQFYWKDIAQLRELSTIDEEINDRILGNLLHKTLELLYQPFVDSLITETTIKKIMGDKKKIDAKLNKAFEEEKFAQPKEGRNLLLKKVIRRLVMKILEKDCTYAPFEIVGLEASEYTVDLPLPDGKVVGLKGTIDRIDRVTLPDQSQYYRILDYKSGRVDITTSVAGLAKDTETYLSKYFVDPKFKAGLQVYLYAYLFWSNQQRNIPVQAGLYVLREINKGILFLRDGEILSTEFFEAFEVQLQNLLSELFNYNYPFMQTENDVEKRYEYSPYKGLLV